MSREKLKQASMAAPSHAGCGCPMVGYDNDDRPAAAGTLRCVGCGDVVPATAGELAAARLADEAWEQLQALEEQP